MGVDKPKEQVGFCRVITDYATFMYLADVFILEGHRGKKLSVAMMEAVVSHPDLQGIRTWTLLTRDAQDLYRKFAFENHIDPTRFMIREVANPYDRGN
jgi:GNAT superfamily N-acetyltransferase